MDPMVSIARITPRLLPFDTGTFSRVECFTVDPLDEKLLNVDLASVKSFSKELLYDLRLGWEALCAENVHEDNFPGFVV